MRQTEDGDWVEDDEEPDPEEQLEEQPQEQPEEQAQEQPQEQADDRQADGRPADDPNRQYTAEEEDFLRRNPGDWERMAGALASGGGEPMERGPGPSRSSGGGGGGGGGGGDRGNDPWSEKLFNLFQEQYAQSQADRDARKAFDDNTRSTLMEMIRQGQQPVDANQIANSPEARGFARISERAQGKLRGQAAERAAQMGIGAVQAQQGGAPQQGSPADGGMPIMMGDAPLIGNEARGAGGDAPLAGGPDEQARLQQMSGLGGLETGGPEPNPYGRASEGGPIGGGPEEQTRLQVMAGLSGGNGGSGGSGASSSGAPIELGGALGAQVTTGAQQSAENIAGFQSQLMARDLQGKRQQLMGALQMGASDKSYGSSNLSSNFKDIGAR